MMLVKTIESCGCARCTWRRQGKTDMAVSEQQQQQQQQQHTGGSGGKVLTMR
jgi:hypothetical protein